MYWDIRGARAFKAAPRPSIRKTTLVPRKLDSLISPWAIYLVVVLYLCNTGLALYAGFSDPALRGRVGGVVLSAFVMLGLIYWHFRKFMRTARDDAYESNDDFWARGRRTMRVFVSAVALAGIINFVGLTTHLISGQQDNHLLGGIIVSVLLQAVLIIELRWMWYQLKHKDYSVYRLTSNE